MCRCFHAEEVIAAIGVDNLVIIDTSDALLVAERSKSHCEISG